MSKKILIILKNSSGIGGAELMIDEICSYYQQTQKYECYIAIPGGTNSDHYQEKYGNVVNYNPNRLLQSTSRLLTFIKEKNLDIVYAHDVFASILACFLKFGQMRNKKLVFISHIHNNYGWYEKKSLKAFVFNLTMRHMNRVVVVSNYVKQHFAFLDERNSTKINVVYNYLNKNYEKLDFNSLRQSGRIIIGFCGRLSEEKNPQALISISKILSEVHEIEHELLFIGSGSLSDEIESECLRLKIPYKMTGFVDDPESFIRHCDVLVVPSRREGFGRVIIEGLYLGKPVIASKEGGIIDIDRLLNTPLLSLCDKEDYLQFANEIQNQQQLQHMRKDEDYQKCRRLVMEHFSFRKFTDTMEVLYENC
ncbi:glycosyltransferase family 4 protein [Paenibacillus sp. HJGM_3]|uniref:glycosyltransferase family 4 protein n=1 Tax=Paenibacillus sp. HJGM_3 TaxID=3379816 RepID=UPI003858E55D